MLYQNSVDLDSYNTLTANEQLKLLNTFEAQNSQYINDLKQTNYKTRVKEAKEKDPNYVEHKIYESDIEILISILANEIDSLDQRKLHSFDSKKAVKLAWKKLDFMKDDGWVNKIKKRGSLYLFESFSKTNQDHKWGKYIKHLLLQKRTNNQILLILTNHAFLVKKVQLLELNESLLNKQIRQLEVKSKLAEKTILKLKNNITPNVSSWQKTALHMRACGTKVAEICTAVNKGRTAVSNFLNKPESKKILGI